MKNKKNIITSKQLIFTIIGATIGVGILTLSSNVARESQQDSWISVILGASLPIAGLLAMNLIARRHPDSTFAEYCEKILGKWAGRALSLAFILYALVFASIVARIFVNVLKTYLFPTTPIWALSALILFVSAYLASRDARVLARVNELMFFEALVLFLFLFGALPQMDLTFFQPVGGSGLENILLGAYKTFFSYIGIEILLVIYPLVQNKKEVIKAGMTAVLIIVIIYLLVVFAVIGVFGPDATQKLRFGLMAIQKTYTAPVIERAEFFFIIFWVFVAFRPVANMYFACRYTTEKALGVAAPNTITVILFPLALIVSLIPQNFEQTLNYSTIVAYFGIGFLIVVPFFLLVVEKIRGAFGGKHA
ncbi:MAG: GerAB/ArcD/ProY family transporter [Bacillota bacterium]